MFKTLREWPPVAKLLAYAALAVVAYCIWSFIASFVLMLLLGLLDLGKSVPFMEWWKYAGYYGLGHPRAGGPLKTAAITATAIPVVLAILAVLRNGLPKGANALHGFTRWSTYGERLKNHFYSKDSGIILGRDDKGRLLRFGGDGHVMGVAPTGSGKGIGLVIPNCQYYQGSIVVLDPKRENFDFTAGVRAAARQKVFLFDPLSSTGQTHRYNPLDYVRRGDVKGYDDIQRIAQMIYPNVSGDQQFWNDSARSAFCGFACYLMETPNSLFTIGEIYRLLARPSAVPIVRAAIQQARTDGRPYSETCVAYLDDYLNNAEDLVNSIRKSATAKLGLWANPRIDAATSASDFDLREIRRSLHAIYVGVDVNQIEQLRPLLSLFFQRLIDVNVTTLRRKDPTLKHNVLVLLDEFDILGNMPAIANAFPFVRGYNIQLFPIMQTHSQLRDPKKSYGPETAQTIRENCSVEIVFGVRNYKEATALSEEIGANTVASQSRSGPRLFRMLNPHKVNTSESDAKRALLLPQEILRLSKDEAIITHTGMYATKAKRIKWYEEKPFKDLGSYPVPDVPVIEVKIRMDVTGAPPAAEAGDQEHQGAEAPPPPASLVEDPAGSLDVNDELVTEEEALEPPIMPHRATSLLAAIHGQEIDLSGLGLEDGKAVVDALLAGVPTQPERIAAE